MSQHTQIKGTGKSRHLPIGAPGSCLTEADRDNVHASIDLSGPECRRCRTPASQPRVVGIEFAITTAAPAGALDLARSQAADAFGCAENDPALVVSVATGSKVDDESTRHTSDWRFVVNASWNTETGSPVQNDQNERRQRLDRRRLPDRRR